jgi:hypothetical protein
MVLETPIQAKEVEEWLAATAIREQYAEYEETFVILHPFLKVKEGHNIEFDTWKRPTGNEIYNGTILRHWSEIVIKAHLKDIKELDGLLAYLHCARPIADRDAWIRLMSYIDQAQLIFPQTDDYPPVLLIPTLALLQSLGYSELLVYDDLYDDKTSYALSELLETCGGGLPGHARILTPDSKILLATDFDARFSYLSSDKSTLQVMIEKLDLEGFYCNATTKQGWSYHLQKRNTIDWSSPERKDYKAKPAKRSLFQYLQRLLSSR